jgi:hypothetical protein
VKARDPPNFLQDLNPKHNALMKEYDACNKKQPRVTPKMVALLDQVLNDISISSYDKQSAAIMAKWLQILGKITPTPNKLQHVTPLKLMIWKHIEPRIAYMASEAHPKNRPLFKNMLELCQRHTRPNDQNVSA